MNRSKGDLAWDYIRLPPVIQQNTLYKPLGDDTFEFVYLNTLPTLNMSNSDDPPGSFHSSDIFKPHGMIPHAWKYLGRIDDRVTLSTGEKVLPLLMEGRVREQPAIREAVVFGIDRAVPGLLIFRSESARTLSDHDLVNEVWPSIDAANAVSEAFGHISKDMIVCIPTGAFIPAADKESIIRAKVYKTYHTQIQAAYERLEHPSTGGMILGLADLETFLMRLIKDELGIKLVDAQTDFHRAGMDSLRAIQLRAHILKRVANSRPLSSNIVFDTGNVQRLAQHVLSTTNLGLGNTNQEAEEESLLLMQEIIDTFATFSCRSSAPSIPASRTNVLLTGVTGSLGAHLLSQLLCSPHVARIYCVVRGKNSAARVLSSLRRRHLPSNQLEEKATVISGDLDLPDLGVSSALLADMQQQVTHIIHAAWPVNFQLNLRAFTPQLRTLHKLLEMSLSNNRPSLLFCSSVSTAMATPVPAKIPEAPIPKLSHAASNGYAQSKLVAERMIEAAVTVHGANAKILRIGQVIGDTEAGVWSATEAWPLIIRSALELRAMPAFEMVSSLFNVLHFIIDSIVTDLLLATG